MAPARMMMAKLLSEGGNVDDAIGELQSFVNNNPDKPQASIQLAMLQARQGNHDKAAELLEGAAAANPEDGRIQDLLGRTRLQTKDYAGAEVAFTRAIDLKTEDRSAPLRLVEALVKQGKLEKARDILKDVPRIGRVAGLIHRSYGDIYAAQKLYDDAVQSYRAAILNSPDGEKLLAEIEAEAGADADSEAKLPYFKAAFSRMQEAMRGEGRRPERGAPSRRARGFADGRKTRVRRPHAATAPVARLALRRCRGESRARSPVSIRAACVRALLLAAWRAGDAWKDDRGGDRHSLRRRAGRLLKLGEHERFLWDQLDVTMSFAEIEGEFSGRFGMTLAVSDFADFLDQLIDARAVVRIPEGGANVRWTSARMRNRSAATAAASHATPTAGGATVAAAARRVSPSRLPQVFGHSGGAFAALMRMRSGGPLIADAGLRSGMSVSRLIRTARSRCLIARWTGCADRGQIDRGGHRLLPEDAGGIATEARRPGAVSVGAARRKQVMGGRSGAAFHARFGHRLPAEDFAKFLDELIEAGAIVEVAERERPAAAAPIEAPRRRKSNSEVLARAGRRRLTETPAAAIPVAPRPKQIAARRRGADFRHARPLWSSVRSRGCSGPSATSAGELSRSSLSPPDLNLSTTDAGHGRLGKGCPAASPSGHASGWPNT